MSAKFRFGSVVVAFLALLSPGLSPAQTPATCPADATALADGAKLSCACAAGASGGVYGSDRYTADSAICAAAVHAGKIPASGGAVDVVVGGACPAFAGSTRNGVTTTTWSSYEKSFGFGATIPACGSATVAAAPAPATAPATAGAPATSSTATLCPSFITQSDKNKPGDSLTCVCDKSLDLQVGAAYGVDRYSNDSPICVAARHAGKLPEPGGTVTVYVAEGCGKFEGSARNGITTRSWGSSVPGTIAFATPAPACAAPPAAAPPTTTAAAPRPAAPAGPNPRIAWEARAKTYAPFLPEPLQGWKAGDRKSEASPPSPFDEGIVSASRYYELGFDPVSRNRVQIAIYNKPDGSPSSAIQAWRDPAKRKWDDGTVFTMTKIAGRDAMEGKPAAGGGGTIYFLLKNNLFVTVSWQEYGGVTRAHAEEYLKKLDLAKIEALAAK